MTGAADTTRTRPGLRVGVIGAGWWASNHHLPALLSSERVASVALADNDPSRLALVAEAYGLTKTFSHVEALVGAGDVDAVVIASPSALHVEHARLALEHGLHVLVEKPMALRAADAWDLVHRAEQAGRQLAVGYTYHHTPAAWRLRALLEHAALGDLAVVSALFASDVVQFYRGDADGTAQPGAWPDGPKPETYSDLRLAGGGQAATLVTHVAGLLTHLTGARARSVSARMTGLGLPVDVGDAIWLELTDGTLGTIAATGTVRRGGPVRQEMHYFGTCGSARHDLAAGTLEVHYADGRDEQVGPTAAGAYPTRAPATAFVDLVVTGGPNHAPGRDAAAAVELVEAAYRSAAADGVPVAVERLQTGDRASAG